MEKPGWRYLFSFSRSLSLSPGSSNPASLGLTHTLTLFLNGGLASFLGSTRWTISRWSSLKNKEVGGPEGAKGDLEIQVGGGSLVVPNVWMWLPSFVFLSRISCCFGLVSRDQNFHCPSFFFSWLQSCLCHSHFLSLFSLITSPFPDCFFLFSPPCFPFWECRDSCSSHQCRVQSFSQLGPAACRQLGSGGVEVPVSYSGDPGVFGGGLLARLGSAGDARLPPWCRVLAVG